MFWQTIKTRTPRKLRLLGEKEIEEARESNLKSRGKWIEEFYSRKMTVEKTVTPDLSITLTVKTP